jgi:hypothetical protein
MKKRLLISFSGGRTSAYMLWWLLNCWEERHNWEIVVVFANTGLEASETLRFVHECAIYWNIEVIWVEAKCLNDNGIPFSEKGWSVSHQVVNYFTAARAQEKTDGTWTWTPFEEMISILGIPSSNTPFCSDQLKRKAIESYLESIGWDDYYKAIGIRVDEVDRINEKFRELKIKYPLIKENPTTKQQVVMWWRKQPFDLMVHEDEGNCIGCWKKDMDRLCRIAKRNEKAFRWWQYMTDKYGHLNPRETDLKPPFNFYRGNLSPKDIIKMAKWKPDQLKLFAEDKKLNGCEESCEAF